MHIPSNLIYAGNNSTEPDIDEELDLTKLTPTLGLLITGGAPERSLRSSPELATKNELYIPATNCSCNFTDWPDKRDGLWAVGYHILKVLFMSVLFS